MKKIIILTSLLLLIGVGCSKLKPQNNTPNAPTNNSQPEQTDTMGNFTEEEKVVEFKIHYPAYIPEGLTINKENLFTTDPNGTDKAIFYKLTESSDPESKQITVQERKNDFTDEEKSLITNKTEITELLNGFSITTQYESINVNHILFTTKDGHSIQLSSKDFDINFMLKIAKSMDL